MSVEHLKIQVAEILKQREEKKEEQKKISKRFEELLDVFEEEIKVFDELEGLPIKTLLEELFRDEFVLKEISSTGSPSRTLQIGRYAVILFRDNTEVLYRIEINRH